MSKGSSQANSDEIGTGLDGDSLLPFLKWPGGKRWLLSRIKKALPRRISRYHEPFLGGGSMFFGLGYSDSNLSDSNAELIDTYRAVRRYPHKLTAKLLEHQMMHDKAHYYAVRDSSPTTLLDRAARFLYLNRTCWNGLYRVNRQGRFNVPIGTKKRVVLDTDEFPRRAKLLKGTRIECRSFEKSMNMVGVNDLVFIDPPYVTRERGAGFSRYNDRRFTWEDQVQLAEICVSLDDAGAHFVLTNAWHEDTLSLYSDRFLCVGVERSSVLSATTAARGQRIELVTTNLPAVADSLRR